jgi:uncharacterized protein
MDFGVAFGLGILGSLHCAAMCGPLQLALPFGAAGSGRFIAGRLLYQFGRILTYCLLGVLAGGIGKSLALAGFQRWLSIGLGVAMLLGFLLSKRVTSWSVVNRLIAALTTAMAAQMKRRGPLTLLVLGMGNGLLPCGLVYTALAWAVAGGTFLAAIEFMAVFGLGTLPMLLAIGFLGRALPSAWRLRLSRLIPYGVCVVALLLILRGLALGIPYLSPDMNTCCAVGH